jgi:hypothetical protein
MMHDCVGEGGGTANLAYFCRKPSCRAVEGGQPTLLENLPWGVFENKQSQKKGLKKGTSLKKKS